MEKVDKEYQKYKNILVIGLRRKHYQLYGFYNALKYKATKQAYF